VSSNGFRLSQSSLGGSEKESLGSGKLRASKGIPPALTFENIMSGMTCEVRLPLPTCMVSLSNRSPSR